MGRGEPSEVLGLSRAEGCWTFDARDRMPRPSRATAHHLSEIAPTPTPTPLPRAGSFIGAQRPILQGRRHGQICPTPAVRNTREDLGRVEAVICFPPGCAIR